MLRILAPLVTSLFGEEFRHVTAQAKRSAYFIALISLSAAVCVIFLLIAAFLALQAHYSGPVAALVIAAGGFIFAAICFIIMKIMAKVEANRRHRRMDAEKSALLATAALASVPTLLKRPLLGLILPLAGIAAFAFLAGTKDAKGTKKQP